MLHAISRHLDVGVLKPSFSNPLFDVWMSKRLLRLVLDVTTNTKVSVSNDISTQRTGSRQNQLQISVIMILSFAF